MKAIVSLCIATLLFLSTGIQGRATASHPEAGGFGPGYGPLGGGNGTPCMQDMALDVSSNIHLVYEELVNEYYQIMYTNNIGQVAGQWATPVQITEGQVNCTCPEIDVEELSDVIFVTWFEESEDDFGILFSTSANNGTNWTWNEFIDWVPMEEDSWDLSVSNDILALSLNHTTMASRPVKIGLYAKHHTIRINGYVFNTDEGEPDFPPGLYLPGYPVGVDGYYIVQFEGLLVEEFKRAVLDAGAEPFGYVPYFSQILKMNESEKEVIELLDFVHWVGIFQPAYKVSPAFEGLQGTVEMMVFGFKGENATSIAEDIVSLGGQIFYLNQTAEHVVIGTNADVKIVDEIAHIFGVSWIEPTPDVYTLNDETRWVIQTGIDGDTIVHDNGIEGQGQTITYADSGIEILHEAFADSVNPEPGENHRKIRDILSWGWFGTCSSDDIDNEGHGTHVGGTIAGDAPTYEVYSDQNDNNRRDGHSFRGRILVEDIDCTDNDRKLNPPIFLSELFDPALDMDSRIHSNSWGTPHYAAHLLGHTSQINTYTYEHQELLVLFGAGNDGPGTDTLTHQGSAKNALTVGASQQSWFLDDMAAYSSRGPGDGNRLKPDLVAPGSMIWSACRADDCDDHYDQYVAMSGTSMATPAVAGSAALVDQYFKEGWYPSGQPNPDDAMNPSAALIKAVLINGAVEINGLGSHDHDYNGWHFPNLDQGWGRVNLANSLYFSGDDRRLIVVDEKRGLETNFEARYLFRVPDDQDEPLKITVAWSDWAEHAPMLDYELINDIDISLMQFDNRFRGNVFSPDAPARSVLGGAFDDSNNVESIILPPGGGLWTAWYELRVRGSAINSFTPQPFGLVISGEIDAFYPIGWYFPKGYKKIGGSRSTGGGTAFADIDGNGVQDVLFMVVDDPVFNNDNFRYRVGWNMDIYGNFEDMSPVRGYEAVGDANAMGGGVTLYDFDGNGALDGLFMLIDEKFLTDAHFVYKIAWNLNANGIFTGGWTSSKGQCDIGGWWAMGGGVSVTDLDNNGEPDVIFMAIDQPALGGNTYHYRIAWNLDENGDIEGGCSGWSGVKGHKSTGSAFSGGGGVIFGNFNHMNTIDALFMVVDDPAFENNYRFRLAVDFDANGNPNDWESIRGYEMTGSWTTAGGGVAVTNLLTEVSNDVIFMHIDTAGDSYRFRLAYWMLAETLPG